VENDDPTSAAKTQGVILKHVHIDSAVIAKIDISTSDPLDEEISFTFNDWDIIQPFNTL
jgi:hypothetical protein